MAGHNKWSKIKRDKQITDQKKSKTFSKLIKEMTLSVKQSGSNVNNNPKLKLLLQQAKQLNIPKNTIERNLSKAESQTGTGQDKIFYAGYAPYGVALIIECITDNNNRTLNNIRSKLNKYNGSIAKNNALDYLFDVEGYFITDNLENEVNEEEMTLELIEKGAKNLEKEDNSFYITSKVDQFGEIQAYLDQKNIPLGDSGIRRIPKEQIILSNKEGEVVSKLIQILQEDEDVIHVWSNLKVKNTQ